MTPETQILGQSLLSFVIFNISYSGVTNPMVFWHGREYPCKFREREREPSGRDPLRSMISSGDPVLNSGPLFVYHLDLYSERTSTRKSSLLSGSGIELTLVYCLDIVREWIRYRSKDCVSLLFYYLHTIRRSKPTVNNVSLL